MASKASTLSGPDWKDVAEAWKAFEDTNKVHLELEVCCAWGPLSPYLEIVVKSYDLMSEFGEALPSDFVKLRCSATAHRTLEAAFFHALYQLDFKYAEKEFESTKVNKA